MPKNSTLAAKARVLVQHIMDDWETENEIDFQTVTECRYCGAYHTDVDQIRDPGEHDPDCLYALAYHLEMEL